MVKTHEVIIAGGGPAGSAAALELARRGHSVAVVDRARFPRPKLCGGLLTWKSCRLLEAHFGLNEAALVDQGIADYSSSDYAIYGGKRLLAKGRGPAPFYFVLRRVLDARLLDAARQAGAEVHEEVEVRRADAETGTLFCVDGQGHERELCGELIIGADGANSRVRRACGMDRNRWRAGLAGALEITLPASEFPRTVEFPELYSGVLRAGYGWVFPGPGRVVLGICGLSRSNPDFRAPWREYLAFLGLTPDAIEAHGHPLPYGNWLSRPGTGRILLAGDAAGFVEPLFGEGIFFALASGRLAGRAAAHALETGPGKGAGPRGTMEAAHAHYRAALADQLFPEFRGSNRLRWLLFTAQELFGCAPMGGLVRSLPRALAEMVHGMRSYSWLRRKRWDFID